MSVFEQPADFRAAHRSTQVATLVPETEPSPHEQDPVEALDLGLDQTEAVEAETIAPAEVVPTVALGVRVQLHRFQRITGIVGMTLLIVGLAVWRFKPHSQDRLALLILVCAMFLAILHHYSLEENRRANGGKPTNSNAA